MKLVKLLGLVVLCGLISIILITLIIDSIDWSLFVPLNDME
jgi:hypothetical protein